jgi:uncharacterized phage-associated protein
MSIEYRFDAYKAIEVLLYIAKKVPDMYKALKVLYFADREHLAQYGRFICGDSYVAMSHGPVPSGAYDLVKIARGDSFNFIDIPVDEAFVVRDNVITTHRETNLDLLSESDIECLDSAIQQYGPLSFLELRERSHDKAFTSADENDFISLDAIINSLPNSEALIDYVRNDL